MPSNAITTVEPAKGVRSLQDRDGSIKSAAVAARSQWVGQGYSPGGGLLIQSIISIL